MACLILFPAQLILIILLLQILVVDPGRLGSTIPVQQYSHQQTGSTTTVLQYNTCKGCKGCLVRFDDPVVPHASPALGTENAESLARWDLSCLANQTNGGRYDIRKVCGRAFILPRFAV